MSTRRGPIWRGAGSSPTHSAVPPTASGNNLYEHLSAFARFVAMSNATAMEHLRPIERRVLDMQREGVGLDDIATRINKSPEFVERLITWTEIPRNGNSTDRDLSPMQRRVLDLRAQGESREEIASKFKRGEDYIRQVEGLAHFREGLRLLSR